MGESNLSRKFKVGILLVLGGALVAGVFLFSRHRSGAGATLTLRFSVAPADQVDFAARQANSAKFKYLVGKKSGVPPASAQKLSLKPLPRTSLIEVQMRVANKETGERYAASFIEILKTDCGPGVQLTIVDQSIR